MSQCACEHMTGVIDCGALAGPKESVAASAKYPAFREELVATLLHSLGRHPAGALQGSHLTPAGGEDGRPGSDIGGVLRAGARLHAQARLCDWLSASKIALQVGAYCQWQ